MKTSGLRCPSFRPGASLTRLLLAAVWVSSGILPSASRAQTAFYSAWQGGGGSNDWTLDANWQGGTAPRTNERAFVFFLDGDFANPNVDADYSILGIDFTSTVTTSYTIGSSNGSTLTLGLFGLQMSGVPQTIACTLLLGTDQPWGFEANAQLTLGPGGLKTDGHTLSLSAGGGGAIHGTISGGGGIRMGFGSMTLTGASTYTGATAVSSSILRFNDASALASTSNVALSGSGRAGELAVGVSATLAKPISVSGSAGGTFSAAPGTVFTLSGPLTLGNGAALGFGSSGYTGTTVANFPIEGSSPPGAFQINVNAGALRDGSGALGIYSRAFSTVGVNVAGGATYDLNGFGLRTNNLQGGGIITSAAAAPLSVSAGSFGGTIGGAVALTVNGAATIILSGDNTYTGGTTISSGTLQVGNGGASGALGTGGVTNNANLIFNRSDRGLSVANLIGGPGSVSQNGTGSLTFTGANTYAGGTVVGAGRLVALNNGNAIPAGSIYIAGGAVLELSNTNSLATFSQAGTSTFTGTGTLQKTGAGTVQLGGNGGNVNVSLDAGALIDVQKGLLAGSSSFNGKYTDNQASLNIAAGATFDGAEAAVRVDALTGAGTLQGGYQNVGSVTVGVANGSGAFSGVVQDSGNSEGKLTLIKEGAGTQTLMGASAYTGTTTINGGTLTVDHNGTTTRGQLGGTSAITVNHSGTLLLVGNHAITDRLNNAAAVTINSGGRLSTDGLREGSAAAAGIGALTLQGGSSIDFGNAAAGKGSLLAAASGSVSGSGMISIYHWTGSGSMDNGAATNDRLLFAANPHFSSAQFGQFQFYSDEGSAAYPSGALVVPYGSFYEIVPVPEPATWLGGALLLGAAGFSLRGRRRTGSREVFGRCALVLAMWLGASAAQPPTARAATYAWQGGGANNNWSTAANWLGGAAPPSDLANTDLVFGASDAIFPSIDSAYSIRSLTWNAGASAYFFDTGPLTLGAGGFTQNAINAQSFSAPVILGADQTWTLAAGAGALTFNGGVNTTGGANRALTINAATTTGSGNVLNGNLTGGGSLSKTGAGLLTLGGTASTYSGGTTISAGTLAFKDAGALGTGTVLLGGGELRATADVTLNNTVSVSTGSAGAISAAPNTTLTLNSLILATGNLTVGAAGQTGAVTLGSGGGNAASSSATLVVNAGTLRAGASIALDSFTSTTVNAGATLDLNGFNTTVNNLQGAGAITTGGTSSTVLTVNAGSFSGAITGSGALTKATAGALVLTGANTYAGPTTLSGGTLQVGDGGTGGTLGAGSVTNNAALVFNRSDALAYNGAITGTGTLAKQGAGTLTLGGSQAANTFTGLTSVTAGTLVLNKSPNVAALAGALSIGNSSNPGAAGSVVVRLLNGGQTGSGTNVTILPDGLLDFNSTTARIGALTMTGGTLACGGSVGGPDLSGDVTINASAAGSRITGTGTLGYGVGLLTAARTFSVADGAARYDLDAGATLFNGTLVKAGPGALRLDGTNSASSLAVTLNAGTLAVGRDAALRGMPALTLAGGTIVPDGGSAADAGARTVSKPVNVTGNATVGSSLDGTTGGLTFSGATSLAAGATLTVSSNAGTTFSNVVSGPGSLVKTGAGTLTLGHAANTFTGGLTLNGGTLAIAGEGSLGGAANVVTLNAGRLQFTTNTTTTRTFNFNNALTLGTAAGTTLTFGNGASVNGGFLGAGGTLAFTDGSALSGATTALGSVVTTIGAVSFTNANLRGATTVNAGSTLTATNTALSSAGTLTVNGRVNSTGLESSGVTTINNGGTVANSGGSLYLGGGSRTTVNTGGTLSAANGTSIELNGGLLTNNGAQTGALNVNFGGVAKGSGTFGLVNVGDGGRFGANTSSGGASANGLATFRLKGADGLAETAFVGPQLRVVPGTANVGSLTLNSGSLLAVNVQDAQETAGAGYDTVQVQGELTLNGYRTVGDQITIGLSSLGSNGSAGAAANFDPSQAYVLTLVTASGGITGFDAASFQVDASSFQNSLGGGRFFVAQDGNNLELNFTPAPEPATWLAGICTALLGAAAWRRRRVQG